MLFYFSGTGNSLYVAKTIAEHIGEKLVSISNAETNGNKVHEYSLKDNETVGFVFPVYAWGAPKMVLEFIEKLKLNQYRNNYAFCIITCGDSIGNAMKVTQECLMKKGIDLNSGFSIGMPNNYVIMGDVDSKEIEQIKLEAAEVTLKQILETIESRTKGEFKVKKGALPWLLTGLVNPLFTKNAINTTKFHAKDTCTGCGICEKVCNSNNIKVNVTPQWGNNCTQCLACIHYCPTKAVQYGKGTESKGRYTNPLIGYNDISKKLYE